jgi:diguanylate cyclase (GGDEF)-like protein
LRSSRPGRTKILPASPTDLRSLVENYVYPLIVCEEEGKILFFNGAAQGALGESELLGRPLPESWKQADAAVEIPSQVAGEAPEKVQLIWQDILWDGNVAWYGVAVPVTESGVDPAAQVQASELRSKIEESQEAALRADELELELRQSREMAAAESEVLRSKLERAQELAEEAEELRTQLEHAREMAAETEEMKVRLQELEQMATEAEELRARLRRTEQSVVEADQLRASLAQSQLVIAEMDELRAKLQESEQTAGDLDELLSRLEEAEGQAQEAEGLRQQLEQSVEMVAVESEKRQAAELERQKLEAKLRDLHQRSLSKLEAARDALESERAERNELSERLARLKSETDQLRTQLEEKAIEVEEARNQSGEQFERVKQELIKKAETLTAKDDELSLRNRELIALEQKLVAREEEFQTKCNELLQAEERADRFRKEYEDLDREMAASQEQSALLTAKLHSVESRMERYQRLMDRQPNEFARGTDDEQELDRLRDRVEELEVELAATSAAARDRSDVGEGAEAFNLTHLQEDCERLKEQVNLRNARISELEEALAKVPAKGTADSSSPVSGETEQQLEQAKTVIDDLRFHRELEYQEARAILRTLQERLAGLQVDGVDPTVEAVPSEELNQLKQQLEATGAELKIQRDVAQSVPGLHERIRLLEDELQEAWDNANTATESMQVDPALVRQVQHLQQELDRARKEASPEELEFARRRIAELEANVATAPSSGGDLETRNGQLEAELQRTREQLQEMNAELRRTLEGDRETKKLAYADQLTGLPNLNLTGQYLQVCFERSGRGEGALALILIDLDHFRRVNDALGQRAGDELLKQVGSRLQRCVTEKDTAIARRGEDEFMVVAFMENARVDGEALMARVRGIAHNLLNELAKPFDIMDQKVQVTASLGVALYPGPAQNRTELLEQSEHAMYKAKETGRARVNFYTEEIHNVRERKRYLESELRQALAHQQFGLLYQPIYDLTNSKIVGVEALLRWSHPTRGVLEPGDFLEVAEDTGLIVQIGDLAVQEALGIAKQKFMKRKFLSINLSYRQLIDSGFSQRFMKHLQVAGVPPHEVIVEVSESATRVDPDRVKNTLAHLAHWGVGIGLDDFGTGTSEIGSLIDMNLRVLKIDTSIISRLPDDRAANKMCHAIAQMASALEIPVLAEGVETREQLTLVGKYGCQYAQGLILGGPMNVSQLIQHL